MNYRFPFLLFMLVSFTMHAYSQNKMLSKGIIKAGKFRVYYEKTGNGNAFLLLHAGLQDHTMWQDQVKKLSAHYTVITPDLPYHGRTTGIDTVMLTSEVLRILLDSLHIEKTFVGGLSMGAAIAQDFMIAYPGRVRKVILMSSGINGYVKIKPLDSLLTDYVSRFDSLIQHKDTVGAAVIFTKTWAEGIYRHQDHLQAPVSKYVYRTALNNLRLHKYKYWPALQNHPPALEQLSSVHLPVLVIYGDKDLPYIIAASQYLVQHIQGAKQIEMKGVAHMLNMEKPEELNRLIMDFLNLPE